jgi:hypothetical protein
MNYDVEDELQEESIEKEKNIATHKLFRIE